MLRYQERIQNDIDLQEALAVERPRIARLCAAWLGDGSGAEDATQETLIEAWTHIERLRDPRAFGGWLTGIARNVCARRARARGRERARVVVLPDESFAELPGEDELTVTLERHELARLLDRALALLPEESRALMIQKYLDDAPNEEIAARLGLSKNALAVRLHRGKMALRELLSMELAAESGAIGLPVAPDEVRKTTLWCPLCGRERLLGKWDAQEFALRCPGCHREPGLYHAHSAKPDGILRGLKGYKPALNRFTAWMERYFYEALPSGEATCAICRRQAPLRKGFPAYAPASLHGQRGLHVYCSGCDSGSYASLEDFALGSPEGRAFYRANPRIRALPQAEIDYAGSPAVAVGYTSLTSAAAFTVIYQRETYARLALFQSKGPIESSSDALDSMAALFGPEARDEP